MSTETVAHSDVEMGSNRSFGIVFTVVFAAIGAYPLVNGDPVRIWSLLIALTFLIVALAVPKVLRPLNVLWFKFGMLLSRIVNPVVMFIIYVVAVLPTALYLRIVGKDLLRLELDETEPSYWIVRTPPGPDPDSLEDLF